MIRGVVSSVTLDNSVGPLVSRGVQAMFRLENLHHDHVGLKMTNGANVLPNVKNGNVKIVTVLFLLQKLIN